MDRGGIIFCFALFELRECPIEKKISVKVYKACPVVTYEDTVKGQDLKLGCNQFWMRLWNVLEVEGHEHAA